MRFLVCGLLPLLITVCLIGFVYHWALANSTERPQGNPKELEKTASVWLRSAGVLALIWLPLAAVYFEDNILRYAPRTVRPSARCQCGYPFTGLSSAHGEFTCPECGRKSPS